MRPASLDRLSPFDDNCLVVLIETPKGSPNKAEQTEDGQTERNDRLLAVAANSATHRSIKTLNDLSPDLIERIEHFFVSYNEARGRRFRVLRRVGPDAARKLVAAAERRFEKKGKRGSRAGA